MMTRLQTYAAISVFSAVALVYHAFSSRTQFYPAMVYLSTSKISLVLLLNMGLLLMCILWQLTKRLFLGSLREAEVERLNDQSWRELMEILFVITIFRQDFSVSFLAMVTALLFIKALHWLAQKRVEYIETTPSVPWLSHFRIVSFIGFLLFVDCIFLYSSLRYLVRTRQASVTLFFAFEYMILATTTMSIFVKYVFYVSDMLMEGQWEKKAVYTFYLELIRDLLHLSMYLCFFLVIFMNYGLPLHLIRELYETFRNFKIRIADYMRYRRITSNMNDRFPEATAEELSTGDATCIICREEMSSAKKLLCGHLFHVHCLRSWLERQNTCPTCRAPVVPVEAGSRHDHHSNANHQAGSAAAPSSGSSSVQNEGATPLTRHQARLQVAADAASLYSKSFVYPSPNPNVLAYGYACLPRDPSSYSDTEPAGDLTRTSPTSQYAFVPFAASMSSGETNGDVSQLETQKMLLQQQIEVLQRRLELVDESSKTASGDEGRSCGDSKEEHSVASS